ncbi:peptide ABC transporter substrate-binding protein [Lichenicoccus sp.]|uniref:peptide ABC transporter substrate-binding protein n=1 Tax=Lichenicoccus sp. TaxID=2781899 RepID=UPI003D0BBF41
MALLLAAAPASAACGTVVLPAGVGVAPPGAVTSLSWLLSNSAYNNEAIEQIHRPLVWFDRNLNYDPAMSLASSVVTPDGGRTWLLTIKPWVWSDGVPLTAQDVVFTFDLVRKLGPNYVHYGEGGVPNLLDRVVALSAHVVEIQLTQPVNPDWFLRLGLGWIKPLPAHIYRGLDLLTLRARQTDTSLYAVSDGPFLLRHWQLDRSITLIANPRFGGTKPRIKRLVIDFLLGSNALQALRAGETDAADVPYPLWNLARALPGFQTTSMGGPFSFASMILNFRSRHAPFLRDVRVRQAIASAIDQKQLIDLVFHGQSQQLHGPVPPAMTSFLSPQGRAGYADLDYNPAHARALLEAAGFTSGPDGVRARNGQRLALDVEVPAAGDALLMLQIIQRNLHAVGIALSLHTVEFNQLLATLDGNGQDWDSIVIAWTVQSFPDSARFFSTHGDANYGHYHNARMDALQAAVSIAPDRQALFAAEDYVAEQQPFIFLPNGRASTLTRNGLHGIGAMVSPTGNWAPEFLSLGGALACAPSPQQTAEEAGHAYTLRN